MCGDSNFFFIKRKKKEMKGEVREKNKLKYKPDAYLSIIHFVKFFFKIPLKVVRETALTKR